MKSLKEILYKVEIINVVGTTDLPISSVHFDSRKVKKQSLFVSVKGTITDGHEYISQAIKNGATAIVAEQLPSETEKNISYIIVKNSSKALAVIATNYFENPSEKLKLIGVTGTNGKTSTTLILKNILESHGKKVLQIGTLGVIPNIVNNDFGLTTPDSIDIFKILNIAVEEEYDFAILEVSSHALSQNRIDNLKFDFAGFTNLTLDHLDYHSTIENYFNEKKKLFGLIKDDGSSLILNDSSYGKDICNEYDNTNTISFKNKDADFYCLDFSLDHNGTTAIFNFKGTSIDIASKLVGKYNLENIILAATIAFEIGVDIASIKDGISSCKFIPGRYEFISNKGPAVIISDYGHTPDAYANVLESIKDVYHSKNIKVLLSYADNGQGHVGGIYKATNWIYQGNSIRLMPNYAIRLTEDGVWMLSRNVTTKFGSHNLEKLKKRIGHTFWRKLEPEKHRYLYLLCNKGEKKKIMNTPSAQVIMVLEI